MRAGCPDFMLVSLGKALAGALLTGTLLVLALPLGEQGYLAWFALVPLLAGTRNTSFVVGFVAAISAIFVLAAWAASGAFYAIKDFSGLSSWVYTGCGIFGFAMALTVALWADKGVSRFPAWWFAAIGVLFEALLLLEIPGHIALSQYRHPLPLLLASFGGVWLVSFAIWWANLALSRSSWKALAIAIPVIVVSWFATKSLFFPISGELRRFAAVQTEAVDEETLTALHLQASAWSTELVVWPEFSGMGIASADNTSALVAIAKRDSSSPFVTTFRDSHQPLPHNVAQVFDSSGPVGVGYAKRKPFASEKKMHAPGNEAVTVQLGNLGVGLNICFDSCYPAVIRDTAKLAGTQVLALPTIDPPSSHHFIAAMHAAYTPFRAAETGLPIIRADGTAFSMLVNGRGAIVAEAPPGERVLTGQLPVRQSDTQVLSLGDAWLLVCGILVVLGLFDAYRKASQVRIHSGLGTDDKPRSDSPSANEV